MLVKLAKIALVSSGAIMVFGAGVGTGAGLALYAMSKVGTLLEDMKNQDEEDETRGPVDAPVKDFSEV